MSFLALATLGDATQVGSFLFVSLPTKVAKAGLSHVAGVIALTFANGNTACPISVALPKVCQGKYSSVAVTGVITGIVGGVIADVIVNKCRQFECSLNEPNNE